MKLGHVSHMRLNCEDVYLSQWTAKTTKYFWSFTISHIFMLEPAYLRLMDTLLTSWNIIAVTELQFLCDITRGQRQTTACNIYRFSFPPLRISNIKDTVDFTHTGNLQCTYLFLRKYISTNESNPLLKPSGRLRGIIATLMRMCYWSNLSDLVSRCIKAQAALLAQLFRPKACGDFSLDIYKLPF